MAAIARRACVWDAQAVADFYSLTGQTWLPLAVSGRPVTVTLVGALVIFAGVVNEPAWHYSAPLR